MKKVLSIEVEVENEQSAPIVKINWTKESNDMDLIMMAGAALGIVYSIVKQGKTFAKAKQIKSLFTQTMQRYMTEADKQNLVEKPRTEEAEADVPQSPLKKLE
tara:strand:- start:717 stop:1025 length:309 start_codon:yes stop_codon:yes gene_type:complete